MIGIVSLLAKNRTPYADIDQMELCAAHERLQKTLRVLERTLQSIDSKLADQPEVDRTVGFCRE